MQEKNSGTDYQIFLSYRGADVRRGFGDCLHQVLVENGFRVFTSKDEDEDDDMEEDKDVNEEEVTQDEDDMEELRDDEQATTQEMSEDDEETDSLNEKTLQAINECRVYIPIFSKHCASEKCCLQELAAIVESCKCSAVRMIAPIFYDVTVDDFLELVLDFLSEGEGTFGSSNVSRWKEAAREVMKLEGWQLNDIGYVEFSKLVTREVLIKFNAKVIGTLHTSNNIRPISGLTSGKGKGVLQAEVLDYSYDVYLSFKRSDARQVFVDVLSQNLKKAADICFFEDNPVLISAEDLERRSQAINNSELCVPILTKTYASSLCCLLELEEMVQSGKKIIPVFYGVKPSDVGLETELYRCDLRAHEEFLSSETVQQWEWALQHVALIEGWEVEDEGALEFSRYFSKDIFVNLLRREDDQGNLAPVMDKEVIYSGTLSHDYEVFLSFTAVDAREEVGEQLYYHLRDAGISVFRNDEDIPISKKLETHSQVIKTSKVCIPVFSKAYASSKWCLRELARMVEYGKEIIPIFYDVEHSDVMLRTNRYQDALLRHQKIFPPQEVEQWKEALAKTANINAWELKSESILDDLPFVIEDVLLSLKAEQRLATNHLVGLGGEKSPVKDVLKMLDVEASDVRFIGIYGMGGIGKTTLAKAVFNQLSDRFDCCSFLANVKTSSETTSLPYLRAQIMLDLLGDRVKNICEFEGLTMADKELLRHKKVFIILDDVGRKEQIVELLEDSCWFGFGSRVIITTRDKKVLVDAGTIKTLMVYEIGELPHDQALELFNIHACNPISSMLNHLDLARQVVHAIGGIPLAIEIIGSFLSRRSLELWEHTLQKLKNKCHRALQVILEICYEELGNEAKQIFLDIACFFANREKTNAFYMWEACDLLPDMGIRALLSMSLIKIKDNRLWMHDLVEEFGRIIVHQESLTDPLLRSRVWQHKEALDIVTSRMETTKVEALALYCDTSTEAEFGSLHNLRFLELNAVSFGGDLRKSDPDLKWLSWHFSPTCVGNLITDLGNLVVLDFSRSDITVDDVVKELNSLKVLDLSHCRNLTNLPCFSKFKSLERLVLEGCENLAEIGSSVGYLLFLKHLNIKGCYSLERLPEEISSLTSLEEIFMKGNGSHFIIPKAIGKLKSMLILEIADVQIIDLPESIGKLQKLRKLSLSGCTGIEALPETLGCLKSLVELDISYTDISGLPWSIGNLKELKLIKMEYSSISYLPDSLGTMEKLEELYAKGCTHLTGALPETIRKLSHLRVLDLSDAAIWGFPDTRCLERCHDLQELSELPTSLTRLNFTSSQVRQIPNLSNLHNLVNLVLSDATTLKPNDATNHSGQYMLQHSSGDWLGFLPKLVTLNLSIRNITSLPSQLGALPHLKTLTLSCEDLKFCLQFPPSLSKLVLRFLKPQTELVALSNLKNLLYLEFDECEMLEDTLRSLKIDEIESLEHLYILRCSFRVLSWLHLPHNLRSLGMADNLYLSELPQFQRLRNLRQLSLLNCPRVIHVEGLRRIASLQEVIIKQLHELEWLPNLFCLKKLEVLRIEQCEKLQRVEGLAELCSLQELFISGCKSLNRLEGLQLTQLRVLIISGCQMLKHIDNLPKLASLREVIILGCNSLKSLKGLRSPCLRLLIIDGCHQLQHIGNLQGLESLQELCIRGCDSVTTLEGLQRMTRLRVLKISGCQGLKHIDNLQGLESLQELFIGCWYSRRSLEGLQFLTRLRVLIIDGWSQLEHFNNLQGVESLQELFIRDCDSLKRLEGLQGMARLRVLKIAGCKRLERIDNLHGLESLKELYISGCDSLNWLGGLLGLSRLRILKIDSCWGLEAIGYLPISDSLQEVFIWGCNSLKGLEGLHELTHLRVLKIVGCKKLQCIDDLPRLRSLQELSIHGCDSLEDLGDLSMLKELRVLHVGSCEKLRTIKGLLSLSSLKDLQIYGCKLLESNFEELKPLKRSCPRINLGVRSHTSHPTSSQGYGAVGFSTSPREGSYSPNSRFSAPMKYLSARQPSSSGQSTITEMEHKSLGKRTCRPEGRDSDDFHGGGMRCSHEGCPKAARGKSGLCIRHGGGKRCCMDGCSRGAEGRSALCISHGGGQRCQFVGCSRGAQGCTNFCKAHGGGKRCMYHGCQKGAEGASLFCKGHGGGKRCMFKGGGVCTKSVHGGTNFCVAHGGRKRCAVPECTRSARGRTAFCIRHGGGKRCTFTGCGKSAQGSTDFCKAHGGGKRCLWGLSGDKGEAPCTAFARGRTGLCALHNSMVQDKSVHEVAVVAPVVEEPMVNDPGKNNDSALSAEEVSLDLTSSASGLMTGFGFHTSSRSFAGESAASAVTVPKGRAHGESLMAMLNRGSAFDQRDDDE